MNTLDRRRFLISIASLIAFAETKSFAQTVDQANSHEAFSFAVVSGVHLINGRPDNYALLQESQLFLQDCVKQLNSEKLDFVIFLGNQIEELGENDSNWQLFLDICQSLNCPWTFVLGSTDVRGRGADKLRTYSPDWRREGIETNTSYWSHNPLPNIHLIGLDTAVPDATAGFIGEDQCVWLEKDLEANKNNFTIVFSHHPLLPPPPFDTPVSENEFSMLQAPRVRDILSKYGNVKLAFSGHINVSKIMTDRNTAYISCPSLDIYPCSFRIVKINGSEAVINTQQVHYPALIKKALNAFPFSDSNYPIDKSKKLSPLDAARGSAKDQNTVLNLAQLNQLEETKNRRGR